jgi:SHS2 domain-containing protein
VSAIARWEHFAHEADMGVRGVGGSREEAFAQAALAMTAIVTDPAQLAARIAVPIACEAPDDELLLVDWLNALIYEMATRRLLFARFELRIDGGMDGCHLDGTAWGEPTDRERHAPVVEVKGATYTALRVTHEGDAWIAQCVVDV